MKKRVPEIENGKAFLQKEREEGVLRVGSESEVGGKKGNWKIYMIVI